MQRADMVVEPGGEMLVLLRRARRAVECLVVEAALLLVVVFAVAVIPVLGRWITA